MTSGVVSAISAQDQQVLIFCTTSDVISSPIILINLFCESLLRNVNLEPRPFAPCLPACSSDTFVCIVVTFERWSLVAASYSDISLSSYKKFPLLPKVFARDSRWPLKESPCFPRKMVASTILFIMLRFESTTSFLLSASIASWQSKAELIVSPCKKRTSATFAFRWHTDLSCFTMLPYCFFQLLNPLMVNAFPWLSTEVRLLKRRQGIQKRLSFIME